MSLWQNIFSTATSDLKTKRRSLLDLCIGDTVSHDLIDYLVVGQVTYHDDSGFTWTDYELEGDGDTWLVFERDLDTVAVYKPADLSLTGQPPKQIKYQGIEYSLANYGRAEVTEVNGIPVNTQNLVQYWQYEDKTGIYVIYVEAFNDGLDISHGYCIRPREIRLLRKLRAIY